MDRHKRLNGKDFPQLRWPLRVTTLGLWGFELWQAFWPLVAFAGFLAAFLLFDALRFLPPDYGPVAIGVAGFGAVLLGLRGWLRFRAPNRADVIALIDRDLAGQPLQTLADELALGRADSGSLALWRAHLARLRAQAGAARAQFLPVRLAASDPFAMRLFAPIAVVMALLFGQPLQEAGNSLATLGSTGQVAATGPAWEGWLEPPAYTGKPALYLADLGEEPFAAPAGSRITLRFYLPTDAAVAREGISGGEERVLTGPQQVIRLEQSGQLALLGEETRAWNFVALADGVPEVSATGEFEVRTSGLWRQPFEARDDYGVQSGFAELELALDRVDRRHGLFVTPEPRAPLALDLPFPFTGDRTEIEGVLEEELAKHPWAGLPVTLRLGAQDAARQVGYSPVEPMILPARRFYDPLAASIVEQRRDLLWSRENAGRVAQMLRAVSYQPDDTFELQTDYLRLRQLVRRLELLSRLDRLTPEAQEELAEALWALALSQEIGQLGDAKERLERAQERLQEAMRDGASDEEIAELMQELRDAMREYIEQLAEQSQQNPQQSQQQQSQQDQRRQEITNEQMDQLLERLQELMEQGRMAEAQELLEQLRQMLENMEITQGQEGQENGPGQDALDGLGDTLQEQQELSDDTFGDLQEQFGEGGDQGENEGQEGEQGQGGQMGQDGPGGQQGRRGENGQFGNENGQGQGQGDENGSQRGRSLADRQQALREMLQEQLNNLPGRPGGEGDGMRQSLDQAGRAMDEAEQSLREGDLGGALEDQADAMEALREGMRELAESLRDEPSDGTQGQAAGENANDDSQDPLGRRPGNGGQTTTDEQMLQGQDVYRRAEDLLNELRRRSGDQNRSAEERDYLERLLRQF